MIRHVAFGVILDDIVFPDGTTRMGVLGGGGPQTAWGMAAALGGGEAVGLVAGVGDDLPPEALAPLRAARIDLNGVRQTGRPTPRAWQITEFDGRRTQVWRVPPSTLGVQLARHWDVLPPAYRAAQTFHWGIHPDDPGPSLVFAADLVAQGRRVSLEPFKPPDRPLSDDELRGILAACEIFSPNWHEAVRLAQTDDERALIARFRELGCRILALRRGADGADVWDLAEGRGVHVPAIQTAVVDAVGAGNAFCGALAAAWDAGLEDAACHASAAASYLIEQVGLPPALPDKDGYARRLDEARRGLVALALD